MNDGNAIRDGKGESGLRCYKVPALQGVIILFEGGFRLVINVNGKLEVNY